MRHLARPRPRLARGLLAAAWLGVAVATSAAGQTAPAPPAPSVTAAPDGRLAYHADQAGNRLPDFSHAGYRGGGVPLPDVAPAIAVTAGGGRDRERIQAAIDLVSARPPDARGVRGAVLLGPGTFRIDGHLRIAASGVVLRGAGPGEAGTTLVATGTSRRALIVVAGQGERTEDHRASSPVVGDYVPVGARTLRLANASAFRVGDGVVVRRPSPAAWIARLGMDTFPGWRPEDRLHWQPGSRDIVWDRVVTAVEGDRLTLDVPLTTALEAALGGGTVTRYDFPGRIAEVGVEDLRLVSEYDAARPADEDHAWFAIALDNVRDAWVRRVTARHFVSYVINAEAGVKWLTVEDVHAQAPVSEVGGYRRRVFYTAGQLTLFRRCTSEGGRRDFGVGFVAAGPNVFLESRATGALDWSGPLESWASGVLYDNVVIRGNGLRLTNRGTAQQGMGWTAANSVLWNCEATDIEVQVPPGATNQAYGCRGVTSGAGIVDDPRAVPYRDFFRGTPTSPRSLYLTQLAERLGEAAVRAIEPAAPPAPAPGVPAITDAQVDAFVARERAAVPAPGPALRVADGRFLIGDRPAWTATTSWSWFQMRMPRGLAARFGPAITRFAPGRTGRGLTDDLADVVASVTPGGVFVQHYGLWYDRRRVDHNYYGSNEWRTGEVWAPFVELPWARSGEGKAWDGLSKYDLTRFNPWYFQRVRAFADLADRHGRVLYYNFYFQHWLLESRSHYVDFPWRPVNALQATGLPDEVPAANAFYDVSHPVRRDLHQRYIRHVLDTLGPHANVVFGIDREYTGDLQFLRFWLDEIAAWQRAHGRTVFVALEVPKDQMDDVLADPERSRLVHAIGVHGWLYRADGELFAIRGGLDRAPREQRPDIATPADLEAIRRTLDPEQLKLPDFQNGPEFQRMFDTLWAGSTAMKYRAWREYRDAHPHLVQLQEADAYPALTAAVDADVPRAVRAAMRPVPVVVAPRASAWAIGRPGEGYLVYSVGGHPVSLDLAADGAAYQVRWLGVPAGDGPPIEVKGGARVELAPPAGAAGPVAAWLTRAGGPR